MLRARVPAIAEDLLGQLVSFVQSLRLANIRKPPSIAESVDWARTLLLMHASVLDVALVRDTLNVLLKRETDIQEVQGVLAKMTQAARESSATGAASGNPAGTPSGNATGAASEIGRAHV